MVSNGKANNINANDGKAPNNKANNSTAMRARP